MPGFFSSKILLYICCISLIPIYITNSYAQDPNSQYLSEAGDAQMEDWTVMLGVGNFLVPEYPGASSHDLRFVPVVHADWNNVIAIGTENDRAAYGTFKFYDDGRIVTGFKGVFDLGRDESDSGDLTGLGDIGNSLEVGFFTQFEWGAFEFYADILQDILDGHEGSRANLEIDYRLISDSGRYFITVGPRIKWMSDSYMESYFGITPQQSANSGLMEFAPAGGVGEAGLAVQSQYSISGPWKLGALFEASYLMGDAADSPLIQTYGTKNQYRAGLMMLYKF